MIPLDKDPLYQAFLRDWDHTVEPELEDDPLAPARGIFNAILGSVVLVGIVAAVIVVLV